jgi:hypothetical protein
LLSYLHLSGLYVVCSLLKCQLIFLSQDGTEQQEDYVRYDEFK